MNSKPKYEFLSTASDNFNCPMFTRLVQKTTSFAEIWSYDGIKLNNEHDLIPKKELNRMKEWEVLREM